MDFRYTVYKITNLVNGKFYIGKHQTTNPNDSYFGSGKAIIAAIKQYGKKNFMKEILYDFDNEHEMNLKEIELVTELIVNDSNCYNMTIGGEGGPHFRNKTHSAETIEKIKTARSKQLIKPVSDETKIKISKKSKGNKSKTGQTVSDEVKAKIAKSLTGRKHSEETKQKLREIRLRNIKQKQI